MSDLALDTNHKALNVQCAWYPRTQNNMRQFPSMRGILHSYSLLCITDNFVYLDSSLSVTKREFERDTN